MKKYVVDVVTGEKVAREDAIRIETVTGKISKGGAYIARDSALIDGYHGGSECGREPSKTAENAVRIRWGIEFECKFNRAQKEAAIASLMKKGSTWKRPERDCSLHETEEIASMEIHAGGNNLRALCKDLETAMQWTDPTDPDCGCHFNLSFPDWSPMDYEIVARNADFLFGDLLQTLKDNPEKTKARCGRYFVPYADDTGDYTEHRNWLNLSHCYEYDTSERRFEWRLAKCMDPRQYTNLARAIVEVFKAVEKWYLRGSHRPESVPTNITKAWEAAWKRLEK